MRLLPLKWQLQQQVTTKDLKKVEAGKRLAEYSHREREERPEPKLTYYGAGAVVATGALGVLGYYVYQSKRTPNETMVNRPKETPAHKFEME